MCFKIRNFKSKQRREKIRCIMSEIIQFGVNCILGIMQEVNTHSEKSQQQLDAFAVQPTGDKRKSNSLQQGLMGMWGLMGGRKWTTVCETFHRISCPWHTHMNTQHYCIHVKGWGNIEPWVH